MERGELVNEYLQILDLHNRKLDYTFLNDLVTRHVSTFAFSSVGCQLGNELPLDFESLFQRIVVYRRGGYCFEQNGLLFEVLEELGFSPELYLARVIYDSDVYPGLTHRVSIVEFEGQRYVLDVGFGPLGLRIPVPLSGVETKDGEKIFRVHERQPGQYYLQVIKDGEYFSLYRFELSRYYQADCEVGHFYSHKHPDATFVNHLVVSRIMEHETRSLRNLEYWVITDTGTQNQKISDASQLRLILVDELGVQVTETECKRLFDKLGSKI